MAPPVTDGFVDPARYLARIGVDPHTGPPSYDLLAALQLAHLVHVPFENLHVYHRRPVRTDIAWSYPKVVDERRGGWCFELNGAFGTLLAALGFDVDFVSCQVWNADPGEWGPELDHLALVVHLGGARWLVDVGFGDNCLHPLLLENGERSAVPRRARVEVDDDGFTLTELVPMESGETAWEAQDRGSFVPRALADFEPRSRELQQPDTNWATKPFATRALDGTGRRITLRRDVLRLRDETGEIEMERRVEREEWPAVLEEHFGLVDLPPRP